MKHKRIYLPKSIESGSISCDIFCYCSYCGTEIVSNGFEFFQIKNGLTCPVCGSPIQFNSNGCYLDMSCNKKRYDDWRFPYSYYYHEDKRTIELYKTKDIEELPEVEKEKYDWLIPRNPGDWHIDHIFYCMKDARRKAEEIRAAGVLDEEIKEYETQSVNIPEADVSTIKKDPETLKQYIEHLINLESAIYSIKQRLEELIKLQVPIDEEIHIDGFLRSQVKREKLEKAKEAYNHIPSKAAFRSQQPQKPEAPLEPKEPEKPDLKKAGLFNRKKIQEENDAVLAAYEKRRQEYEDQLKTYEAALAEYKRALNVYDEAYSTWERKTEEKIKAAERAAAQRVKEAEESLAVVEKNPPETRAMQKKKLLTAEIEQAKKTLKNMIKAKNELFSLNVIFGKYRDIVALTSFYEYLVAGRCETLEGKDGAYNLYEGEIRANQIISQLSEVVDSLEKIKNGQYMVYSTIKGVYSSLEQLNSKTEAALDAMNTMRGDISRISKQNEIIAYNSEQAAFYARKNKELTDALGFMVALK